MITAAELIKSAKANITEVEVEQFQSLINEEVVLIDVREPGEFNQGHIEGALNLPRGVLEMQLTSIESVKSESDPLQALNEKTLLIYCRSGGRGALAAESLQKMGFNNVINLAGGYGAWLKANQ